MQGKTQRWITTALGAALVSLIVLAGLAARFLATEWERASESLARERRNTVSLAAGQIADEFDACTTAFAQNGAFPESCKTATAPFEFFQSRSVPSRTDDALRASLADDAGRCDNGDIKSCETLVERLVDIQSQQPALAAYFSEAVLSRLTEPKRPFALRIMAQTLFDDVVARHKTKIEGFPQGAWVQVGEYKIQQTSGGAFIGIGPIEPRRLQRFLLGQGISDAANMSFSVKYARPVFDQASASAFLSEQLGYLVMRDDTHEATLAAQRRNSKLLLIGLGFLFVIAAAALLIVYRGAKNLADVDRMRANFVAAVSHEYRTPLGAMRLLVDTIRQQRLGLEKTTEYMGRLDQELQRLTYLTENMLALNKMQRGFTPSKQQTAVKRLFDSAADGLWDEAEKKSITISMSGGDELSLHVDPNLFGLVLTNLLSNAIKYSDSASEIEMRARPNGESTLIEVADSGPGIPVEAGEQIFEWFERLQDERTRTKKGTGIGLALARSVVEAHGGAITVKNREPHGAVFSIQLPNHESVPNG